ncbi:hypothetical protein BH10ACT3_BH10ACT3_12500 [soil metagenome]
MQMAAWLSDFVPPPPVPGELIEELRDQLTRVATEVCAPLDPSALPLRVPKSRLADLERCERTAVARSRESGPQEPMSDAGLRGVALDRFVTHQLVAGRVLEPVAALRSMLEAEAEWQPLDALAQMGEAHAAELIDPLATSVADSWSGIDPAWAPRTQSRAMVVLADGAAVCSGVIDVELGGPSTTMPSVMVEVKSGRPVSSHQSEAYLYGLLVALRDRIAPAAVARWYPGGAPAVLPVSVGMLESAALRLEASLMRWAELIGGATPVETPGVWCRWCIDAPNCPSASIGLSIGASPAGTFDASELGAEHDASADN